MALIAKVAAIVTAAAVKAEATVKAVPDVPKPIIVAPAGPK